MKNYILKSIAIVLCFLAFNSNLNAQCSEIYFYRFNNIQCDKPVFLSQDGERIATVRLGDRYKATVCTPGNYTFVAKTNEDNFSVIKTSIDVQEGQNYYVKVGCTFGVDVATIGKKSSSKGKKDFNKGSKFKGAVKDINLKNAQVVTGGGSGSQGGGEGGMITPTVSNSGGFKQSQIVGNFKFDVVSVVKAGDMLSMAFKVTNLTSEDLILYSAFYNIYFYDDMGNLLSANDLCIVNNCENGQRTITDIQKHHYDRTKSLIPYGIPMNMSVNIRGIRNGSKKLTRGVFQMGFYRPNTPGVKTPFDVQYFNIEYPEVVDPNNPNRRVFGSNSLELVHAKRQGEDVITRFRYKNGSNETAKISLKDLSTYDDFGNKYTQRAFSVFDGTTKRAANYRYTHDVAADSEVFVEIAFPKVVGNAQKLRRLTLNLSGYTFEWNNVNIEGLGSGGSRVVEIEPGARPNRTNYIAYNDFETKVRNKESVIGKKIILENIYFNSGSDDILTSSYPQLDQLTQVLLSNNELKLEISGHTDNVGEDLPNMLLSQKRADSIRYYLIGKSIDPSRITSVGKGATQAIAGNSSDAGRQQNRRVEIQIVE